MGSKIPGVLGDVDDAWLTEALRGGEVHIANTQEIGADKGLVGAIARLHITGANEDVPATLIVKLPAAWGFERAFCDVSGFYERECLFYEELSADIGMRVPRCYASRRGPGTSEAQSLRNASSYRPGPLGSRGLRSSTATRWWRPTGRSDARGSTRC